jgi:2-phospho-L-lactate guanylyltransferase
MEVAIVIPVKELARAKQRLAPQLAPELRAELAATMMQDVFAAVTRARGAVSVFVVTSDARAIHSAEERGWSLLREDTQVSESASVDAGLQEIAACGFKSVLRLPIDIPLVEPRDIEQLLSVRPAAPQCVIVPSRDGTGTNALLRTPPGLFPSHFGPQSFAKHCAEAEARGARISVIRNPRIELDLDDARDLREFLRAPGSGETSTGRWLGQNLPAELRRSA